MKGTITRCLAELVQTKWGADTWRQVCERAGAGDDMTLMMPSADIDDALAMALLESTSAVVGVTPREAADAFGEYWCCVYVPRMYKGIAARFKSAREMILGMDDVHVEMTRSIPNARPPRFTYTWRDARTLVVKYSSHRNLVHVYAGLARGVGKLYNEALTVRVTGQTVEIQFA
jgi:hypothetical protein